MLVPLSWIRDFAPFDGDPADLAETLDDLGLVVEGITHIGKGLEDVVVARVLDITAIAGADKIRQVTVDAGGPEAVSVVCGAWNFAVGDLVPLAPVGAVLPGDFAIARRKMKGVTSNGMLCSGRELELSEDHDGILILGSGPEPGSRFVDALGITPDVVYDIAVEANRPDAWSMAGVARDLAARLRLPFSVPDPPEPARADAASSPSVSVVVVDEDLCPRFTARVVTGVTVGPSPALVARRLTLAGMRPINNVVDASNYVMLELGQPTHPYDAAQVAGGGFRIRAARPGETVVTLDGVERVLGARAVVPADDRRDCLICDGDDAPLGIGGIMGGGSSEISDDTTTVLLEAAYFTPMAIARTSKRLGLRSEASARFERGCDPDGIERATRRLVAVLGQSAENVRVGEVVDVSGTVPGPGHVRVRTARVNALLGSAFDDDAVAGYLEPIGFVTTAAGPGLLDVTVPTFRPDTSREIDVIEEVARHHGYSALPRRRPSPPQVGGLTPYQRTRRTVRAVLAGFGAHEAWTPSLLAPGDHERAGLGPGGVEVANPLNPDEAILRRGLLPGMLSALAYNAGRRQDDIRLFEIGHVFPPPDAARLARAFERHDPVIDEREMVAMALAGTGDDAHRAAALWLALAEALGVEDVALCATDGTDGAAGGLHPSRAAAVVVRRAGHGDVTIGAVGEVDPAVVAAFGLDAERRRVGWIEVDLGLLLEAPRRPETVEPISRFPSSDIDLAFVVADDVAAAAVSETLRRGAGALLESLELFDVYRGDGLPPATRSLAYRLRFCSLDRTLTDDEVGTLRRDLIGAVEQAHGGRLRT